MAMFYWKCVQCDHTGKQLTASMPDLPPCPECGADMDFVSTPSSRIVEIRDNGFMMKKVEQLSNIQDLVAEHSTKGK